MARTRFLGSSAVPKVSDWPAAVSPCNGRGSRHTVRRTARSLRGPAVRTGLSPHRICLRQCSGTALITSTGDPAARSCHALYAWRDRYRARGMSPRYLNWWIKQRATSADCADIHRRFQAHCRRYPRTTCSTGGAIRAIQRSQDAHAPKSLSGRAVRHTGQSHGKTALTPIRRVLVMMFRS